MARKKRTPYPDKATKGKSRLIPFVTWESPKKRHERRLDKNLEVEGNLREWCKKFDITLTVTNEGHHWQFIRGEQEINWWPSSAKMVVDKRWRDGIHVHDHHQAKEVIAENWKLSLC